jgi:hypothetical protein
MGEKRKISNKSFNLINPLARFVQNNNAQNAPSPSGTDLKVKPTLG